MVFSSAVLLTLIWLLAPCPLLRRVQTGGRCGGRTPARPSRCTASGAGWTSTGTTGRRRARSLYGAANRTQAMGMSRGVAQTDNQTGRRPHAQTPESAPIPGPHVDDVEMLTAGCCCWWWRCVRHNLDFINVFDFYTDNPRAKLWMVRHSCSRGRPSSSAPLTV